MDFQVDMFFDSSESKGIFGLCMIRPTVRRASTFVTKEIVPRVIVPDIGTVVGVFLERGCSIHFHDR